MSDISKTGINRRRFLQGSAASAGTAALFSAIGASFPGGAFAQTAGPETTKAILGFIALTDASPLIVAKEKGLFAKHGMADVEVVKQSSWGTTRDNLVLGSAGSGIDGAHILTPMPYLMSAGKITQGGPVPMQILARLNLDGQGISIANAFADLKVGLDAGVLRESFAKAKAAGKTSKVAVTFPGGTHDLWMRYWLAAAGIDPNTDVETIVVPPPQMVANLKVNTMDAFCVGEPWNEQMVGQKIGFSALTTGELWNNHPEKSLAMRADWVAAHPNSAKALTMAVLEAQQWCDKAENKKELAEIVGKRAWFNVPAKDIVKRLSGEYDYGNARPVVENSPHIMKFWRDNASYPFKSHDLWFLTEDQRWGYLPADADTKALVEAVNREDIWRAAAKDLGVAQAEIPTSTSRGVETFFDGKSFDPANPSAYLESLSIKRVA
ncbi:bicarbonate-binding protein [Aureimonas ureilytica]|uniref:Bicarbonate-binding protein n=1 Tax=Aureimonas ureilytica TaxID=401562 RepID=A0A175RXE6_9HYPH|nr:CmpA/NrtA family ABC transporter substrate-binding protein [Aureimonas ureilytica]KTR08131.1 bicarbonate-binding protein [Aureimonas ureilytica]